MSNFQVNPAQPAQTAKPASAAAPAAKAAKPAAKPALKDPQTLFAADSSQAKAPPAGAAKQKVEIVDTGAEVTQADVEWASAMEQKAAKGYEATPAEVSRYQNILQTLQARQQAQATAAGVPPEDMAWAAQLEAKANEGYKATPEEVTRYKQILNKLQAHKDAQQPAQAAQPAQPAATQTPPGPQPATADSTAAVAALKPIVQPDAKPPVDLAAKFKELDKLLEQKKYMIVGGPADLENVRQTGVQIWIDGKPEDRVQLAKKLAEYGQSELLGRVMAHVETNELEIAQVMGMEGFPVEKFMGAVDDNRAFLILNSLATVALTGEASSAKVLEKVVASYDRWWDREAPFDQLKNQLKAQGNWEKLPAGLRGKIDELLK